MYMTHPYRLAASVAALLIVAGCASPTHRAPVDDRTRSSNGNNGNNGGNSSAGSGQAATPKVLPGAENAGKPGYYTVKPGDTLIRISLDSGQNWRDIAGWNSLENPNLIEVGQVLRVVPPGTDPSTITAGVSTKPVNSAKLEVKPLEGKGAKAAAAGPGAGGAVAGVAGAAAGAAGKVASAAGGVVSGTGDERDTAKETKESKEPKDSKDGRDADEPNWMWPASGPTIGAFEEGKHKGLSIGGKAGDPVYAAADGRVVYAGSGLRGYGNLIILKHGGDYLTAYAHNQALLVKEEQSVRKGQKIAEMGATDADRVQLHFEIRKQGKPIDPARQLPSR
jgi:lipoprotein NlpD